MLSVTITEKDGPSTTTTFDKTEVLIGRVKGNDVVLPKTNVSKRHSRLVVKDGKIILIDLKSTNGTFVNGRKITGPQVMQEGDKIYIGDFTIEVKEIAGGMPQSPMGAIGLNVGMSSPGISSPQVSAGMTSLGNVPSMSGIPGHIGTPLPEDTSFPRPTIAAIGLPPQAHLGGPGTSQISSNAPMGVGLPGIGGTSMPGQPIGIGISSGIPGSAAPSQPLGTGIPSGIGSPAPEPSAPSFGSPEIPAPAPSPIPSLGATPNLSGPSAPAAPQMPILGASPAPNINTSLPGPRTIGSTPQPKQASAVASAVPDPMEKISPKPAPKPSANIAPLSSNAIATLPEPISVADARTPDSDAIMKAARIVMDNYLSKNDFQAIMAQPYPPEPEMQDACYNQLSACVKECRLSLGKVNVDALLDFLLKEACGLGVIDTLIDDPEVNDFIVYNFETIIVERNGHREIASLQFTSTDTLYLVAQRLIAFQGFNPQTAPAVTEIRFGDGTQIQVVLPPVSVSSNTNVVRKPARTFRTLHDLTQSGSLSAQMAAFLSLCIKAQRNILVVGPQGAGRTTILNALGAEIPDSDRIITIEGTAMLAMPQPYVMSMEAQGASFGQGGDLTSLIRQATKLRAEHVIVDAIQAPSDLLAFLGSICGGAQGSLATFTAINGSIGFNMLKRMISDPSSNALIGNIDIIISVRAFANSQKRIVDISEVAAMDDGSYALIPVFSWTPTTMGIAAIGEGQFKPTGHVPVFCHDLERGGYNLDNSMFNA